MRLNVFPLSPGNDISHKPGRDIVALSDLLKCHCARCVKRPDLNHLWRSQLCAAMSFAFHTVHSLFFRAISHVIFWCSKKKMARIAAWRVVTMMAHKHPVWNWAIRNMPRQTMGQPPHARLGRKRHDPIPSRRFIWPNKWPAFIGIPAVDIWPQPISKRQGSDITPADESATKAAGNICRIYIYVCEFHADWLMQKGKTCQCV